MFFHFRTCLCARVEKAEPTTLILRNGSTDVTGGTARVSLSETNQLECVAYGSSPDANMTLKVAFANGTVADITAAANVTSQQV